MYCQQIELEITTSLSLLQDDNFMFVDHILCNHDNALKEIRFSCHTSGFLHAMRGVAEKFRQHPDEEYLSLKVIQAICVSVTKPALNAKIERKCMPSQFPGDSIMLWLECFKPSV